MTILTGVTASDPPGQSSVRFDWQADPTSGVTRYALEIGTAPGLTDILIADVGLALTATRPLPHGAYWFRLRSWLGAVAGAVTPDRPIVVSNRLGRVAPSVTVWLRGQFASATAGSVAPAPALVGTEASTATGTLTPSVWTVGAGPRISVDEWPTVVPVGARGRVLVQFRHTSPVVLLQARLGTQVIAEVRGEELRDMAGLYFAVPRTPGTYALTIRAVDRLNQDTITPPQSVQITSTP